MSSCSLFPFCLLLLYHITLSPISTIKDDQERGRVSAGSTFYGYFLEP